MVRTQTMRRPSTSSGSELSTNTTVWGGLGGVFAQRGHSAGTVPIITVIIQVTTLKTTHLRNHAQSIQNSKIHLMLAMGPRDLNSAPYSPVHCSSHSMTSFQSSELTELPVVENSQLFAQRARSACTARAQRTVRPLTPALTPHTRTRPAPAGGNLWFGEMAGNWKAHRGTRPTGGREALTAPSSSRSSVRQTGRSARAQSSDRQS